MLASHIGKLKHTLEVGFIVFRQINPETQYQMRANQNVRNDFLIDLLSNKDQTIKNFLTIASLH